MNGGEAIECQQKVKRRRTRVLTMGILLVLMALTIVLRVWDLNTIPPWLFSDEAAYGLDVRELLQGEFRVFFPRNLGREPLFNYLAVPFMAVADGKPIAIRLGAAIMGILMVPVLFLTGKALWRECPRTGVWAGLAAAAFWMVNYWPQSVNRIAFHVNTLPLILTLAVLAWLNWTHRPTRQRALTFGFLAGLTLATYLAARITPLLWLPLYFTLPAPRRKMLRATVPWVLLAFLLIIAPLVVHFALHPDDFLTRMGNVQTAEDQTDPDQTSFAHELLDSAQKVVGMFLGGAGDPNPRHNLLGRPPLPPWQAALLVLGLVFAVWNLRRGDQRAWTLLLWLAMLSVPAILAAEANPHFLRLFGALPAALLLATWPVAWFADWSTRKSLYIKAAAGTLLVLLICVEGVRTVSDYFISWAEDTDLYYSYGGDIWLLGERIEETPGVISVVPLRRGDLPEFPDEFTLNYAFQNAHIFLFERVEEDIQQWLDDRLGNAGGSQVMMPIWYEGRNLAADPKDLLPFYLTREATLQNREVFRGFDLLTFSLKPAPQFQAVGHRATPNQPFSADVTLVEARWGVAYPNPDTNGDVAAAGTQIWAILTWRLERPRPDLKISLDLVDSAGHRLDSSELPLISAQGQRVSEMSVSTLAKTYHLVTVPETQPPGSVFLESRAYDTQTLVPLLPQAGTPRGSLRLATLSTTPALGPQRPDTLALPHPVQASFASGITLLGLDAWPAEIAPGQKLTLRLLWLAETPPSRTQSYTIALNDTGVLATVELSPELQAGHVVHTYADLDLPPDLPTGTFELVLTSDDASDVKLGKIAVAGRPREFRAPPLQMPLHASFGDVATLLGLDVPGDLYAAPGQILEFSLAWKALSTPQEDLVRFVHLLGPDGNLFAQEDTVPCMGACPASSWLRHEVLVEEVRLALPSDLPSGNYSLALGWYNTSTLERLSARDASGRPLADDQLMLPLRVVVAP